MARRGPAARTAAPLFVWREVSELERLEHEAHTLAVRISRLKPHAHYRVELQARLKALRARQLRLECAVMDRR
ncbi:hypothetical protein [Chelativorans alearense]|uniref:hypothetical protein n=1 Tax=Chelativorans alearense TaxID=2681495 RepID=UPI0013CFAE86|nr:hypothetical protein [Chelativorans alearense]